MPPKRTTTLMTDAAIKALISLGVATALAEYEANKGSGNGDNSHGSKSGRRTERATRECTYNEFLKCQPLNFKGTEGVVGLTQWFEKMESVFHISNCTVACQIKFATCTLQGEALTWWNSHVKTYEKKEYAGTLPSPAATNNQRTLTCYECGNQRHYKSDYLELKNQNHGNQAGDTKASGMVYALGGGETHQDIDNMEDDINA
ncbi:hypothetical protein Tco_0964913 [Tanacetum coccineum]